MVSRTFVLIAALAAVDAFVPQQGSFGLRLQVSGFAVRGRVGE